MSIRERWAAAFWRMMAAMLRAKAQRHADKAVDAFAQCIAAYAERDMDDGARWLARGERHADAAQAFGEIEAKAMRYAAEDEPPMPAQNVWPSVEWRA